MHDSLLTLQLTFEPGHGYLVVAVGLTEGVVPGLVQEEVPLPLRRGIASEPEECFAIWKK